MYRSLIRKYNLSLTIFIFLLIFLLVIYLKPNFLFNNDGSIRHFGLGKAKCSIIPIWLFVIFIAILTYTLVMYYITV